jgi:hypothetical protein
MSEKIMLQVGDHAFTTSRETLCMRKGSMLEAMFSGRHKIKLGEDGRIFIDREASTSSSFSTICGTANFHRA